MPEKSQHVSNNGACIQKSAIHNPPRLSDDRPKAKKAQIKQKAQRLKALRRFKIVAEAPILSMHKTRSAPAVLMQRARKALKRRAAKRFIKGQLHVTLGLHVTI